VSGIEAVDLALDPAPDNHEALICKVLLLRLQGSLEADAQSRRKLLGEAEPLLERAVNLQKRSL
jgi:hypothetical protein